MRKEEDRHRNHRCPSISLPSRGMRNMERPNDLAGKPEGLAPRVPRLLGVELQPEGGGEHGGRKVFGIVAGCFVGLPVRMVFREITVLPISCGNGNADG